ncbi:hypothetical protein [Mesorhizobium sp. LjRoot246]|uniref:hypothetical protein n=1 Tax=Mesorhizobium sp. LjRoot246 TaxID=3342294 RepID=UPI003ECE3433
MGPLARNLRTPLVILLSLATILTFLLSGEPAFSQQFKYPKDDLIVLVRAGGLLGLLDELAGTRYEALYHNNGTLCSTPHVTASLPDFSIPRHTRFDLRRGTTNTTISMATGVNIEAAHCTFKTIKVGAGCVTSDINLVGPVGQPIFFFAICYLNVDNWFFVEFPVPVTIPQLVSVPKDFSVKLPNVLTRGNLSINISFGEYDGSKWVKLKPPYDKNKIWPVSGDIGFTNYITGGNPASGIVDETRGSILVAKASATHPRFFNTTADPKEAYSGIRGLNSIFFDDPYAIAGIRIFETLIAPPSISSPSDPRYGLIGGLFPLIVDGKFKVPGGDTLTFNVVFGSFTFSIPGSPANPRAALSIESFSVEDSSGKPLAASWAGTPSASINLPRVKATGDVSVKLGGLKAALNVKLSDGSSVRLSLGSALRSAINVALPKIANVAPGLTLGLPNCMEMGDDRFEALMPCAGGKTRGLMAKTGGPGPINLSVDFSKTSISMPPGEFRLDFEEKCVPTTNPRTEC